MPHWKPPFFWKVRLRPQSDYHRHFAVSKIDPPIEKKKTKAKASALLRRRLEAFSWEVKSKKAEGKHVSACLSLSTPSGERFYSRQNDTHFITCSPQAQRLAPALPFPLQGSDSDGSTSICPKLFSPSHEEVCSLLLTDHYWVMCCSPAQGYTGIKDSLTDVFAIIVAWGKMINLWKTCHWVELNLADIFETSYWINWLPDSQRWWAMVR